MQREDGKTFVTKLEEKTVSPLDVEGIDLGLTADEIVLFIREGRRISYVIRKNLRIARHNEGT